MKLICVTNWEFPKDWGCKKLEDIWSIETERGPQEHAEKGEQEIQTGTGGSDSRIALDAHVCLTCKCHIAQNFPEIS